jgi:YidC/Oxa1 family membrane protein insertase
MNDIRRAIPLVVFVLSLVMLWDHWQVYNGRQPTFFPSRPAQTASAPAPGASGAAAAAVPTTGAAAVAGAVPGTAATAAPAAPHERIAVSTDVLRLTFDTEGGGIVKSEFLKYPTDGGDPQPFVLLDDSAQRTYLAQSGLIDNAGGAALPTHKTPMTFSGPRQLADGAQDMQIRFESPDVGGVRLVKTYTLKRGSYAIAVQHEVVNTGSVPVKPELYLQLVRDGGDAPGATNFYSTFNGPAFYTDAKKYQKVAFKDIAKGNPSFEASAPGGYVAMVQHYFASAWMAAGEATHQNFARKLGDNLYAAGMIVPLPGIAPGGSQSASNTLFIGPQLEKTLAATAPGLELVKDYGWVTILAKPLYWLLAEIHKYLGNWGWSIMALVLLIKIVFFWLNAKAYTSMAKMKALNPRLQDLRANYKDDPAQMQREMMRIYREEKVNPLGGCLPIAIQIPVFIALYWVLLSSVELRGAPWLGWIQDLSVRDPYFILPVVMTLSTMLQTALNPLPPDPLQARMMWMMPLVFSVMFFFFPAGLVLYWITNNLLSIGQQALINHRMGVPMKINLPKFR